MVVNYWKGKDEADWVKRAGPCPQDQELARRVYTSRLIGSDPDLVMHGGGNTSLKQTQADVYGDEVDVLHVKGSGWDLDTIEAPGLPAVRMEPLLRLRTLDSLTDEDMVNVQRSSLLDFTSPNPSVETLLHAFLPHRYIDHTHATSFLALANLPEVKEATREIFGDKMALVDYIMPGFLLAKAAAEAFEQNPEVEGILLVNHGHFAFGDTARQSYDRIVEQTQAVEDWLAQRKPNGAARSAGKSPEAKVPINHMSHPVLPWLRGIIADCADGRSGPQLETPVLAESPAMPVFDLRDGPEVRAFFSRPDVAELVKRGVITPDHVIRTKGNPLYLPRSLWEKGQDAIRAEVDRFAADYRAYFERNVVRFGGAKTMLSPVPRLAWIEDVGVVGMGNNAKAARIAADLGEQTLRVKGIGEDAGGFYPVGEEDLFDLEYWSLEQAKLGKATKKPMVGRVVLITGGAGVIGLATAKSFAGQGAQVFLVDRDPVACDAALKDLGQDQGGMVLDITSHDAAKTAIDACIRRFGGLDVLVSNAGGAWGGAWAEIEDEVLHASFELNFFAHHHMARAAVTVMRAQGRGGQLLFNISKQSVNPGRDFGAYGLPKATLLFLTRQLALELAVEGVRVNGINPDRIRSGVLTSELIASRSHSRGLKPSKYMASNLLGREVEARHVAGAFVALAGMERTTGHVITVDGGNVEAALR